MTRPADTEYRLLVDHIDGDFYTVVGLPLAMLYEELRKNGVDIMDFWK